MRDAARGKGTFTEGCNTRDWFTGNWMGTRYELTRGSRGFIFRPRRKQERSEVAVLGVYYFPLQEHCSTVDSNSLRVKRHNLKIGPRTRIGRV